MAKKKYIYMKLEGLEGIRFFKNENKEGKQPDYRSERRGGGIWIREYEEAMESPVAPQPKPQFAPKTQEEQVVEGDL